MLSCLKSNPKSRIWHFGVAFLALGATENGISANKELEYEWILVAFQNYKCNKELKPEGPGFLFVAQGFNRIELCCFTGRVESEEHAHDCGKADSQYHGEGADNNSHSGNAGAYSGNADAEGRA